MLLCLRMQEVIKRSGFLHRAMCWPNKQAQTNCVEYQIHTNNKMIHPKIHMYGLYVLGRWRIISGQLY